MHTHINRDTGSHTHTLTNKDIHKHSHRHTHTHIKKGKHTHRNTCTCTRTQRHTYTQCYPVLPSHLLVCCYPCDLLVGHFPKVLLICHRVLITMWLRQIYSLSHGSSSSAPLTEGFVHSTVSDEELMAGRCSTAPGANITNKLPRLSATI